MTGLFLKIVNMSISAGWLILAVILLRPLLKRAPRWITVALWGLVGIRLAFPFSIESIFSLIPSSETISPDIMWIPVPAVNTGIPAVDQTVNPALNSMAPVPEASVNPLQVWVFVFAAVWMTGVAVLFSYTMVSYWRLRRRVATAIPVNMGMDSRRGNIYHSDRVESPFVLGIIRPRIYLPFTMGDGDIRSIIAHEEAHIRRGDHWWKPLGFLLLTLHWFNPLVWIAYVLLCRDIELACDEKVIRGLDNDQRADYSQALLSCSVSRKGIAACPLAFGEAGVKVRVKSVLNYRRPAFWVIVAAVTACAAVALCFLTDPAEQRDTMTWARGLSTDMVVSADLVVFPRAPEKQFRSLSEEEITAMVALINQSKGRYLDEYENLNGSSIFFYLTLQDGTIHSVGNIGNTYLYIDGDYYEAKYKWLSTWDNDFGEGNEPLPEGYTFGQTISGVGGDTVIPPENYDPAAGETDQSILQDTAIWEEADLDHDGETEFVLVREQNGGAYYELEVVRQDGILLWSREAGTIHTGGMAILLYESGGKDYLVEYAPTIYQGMGSYTCTQFSLEGGVETKENQWTADFQLPLQQMTGKLRAFAEVGNMIMKDGIVLLSTVEGELVIGPKAAAEISWLYPVSFGEEDAGGSTASGQDFSQDVPQGDVQPGNAKSEDSQFGNPLFMDGQPLEFLFASGAGGWGTTLTLYPDGRFEGVYEDGENVWAPEYPRGTRYICEFSGSFSEMSRISDYAYSMQLEELNCEPEKDQVWIEDEIRYIGAEALGVEGGEEFVLYLPNTPPEELDEEFAYWWPDYYLWRDGSVKRLSAYGLHNVNTGQGFFTTWLQ